jgi:hypothetical protein
VSVFAIAHFNALGHTWEIKVIGIEFDLKSFLNLKKLVLKSFQNYPLKVIYLNRPNGVFHFGTKLRGRCEHSFWFGFQQVNYAPTLTTRSNFVHYVRAVNQTERFCAEKVFPNVGQTSTAWPRFCCRTILIIKFHEKKNRFKMMGK